MEQHSSGPIGNSDGPPDNEQALNGVTGTEYAQALTRRVSIHVTS